MLWRPVNLPAEKCLRARPGWWDFAQEAGGGGGGSVYFQTRRLMWGLSPLLLSPALSFSSAIDSLELLCWEEHGLGS